MIAARSPVAGEAKTRLGAAIGMDNAALLYRAFLTDIANRFDSRAEAKTRRRHVAWTFWPADCDFATDLRETIGHSAPESTLFVPQHGPDWGTRQLNLLRWGAEHGYARIVLMASDSPQLPPSVIDSAFRVLERRDVVIGRVRDGGYYLIGLRGYFDVLSSVPMSTSSAADGVHLAARSLGLTVGETEPAFDVDDVSDLARLAEVLRGDPDLCPATHRALGNLGLANLSADVGTSISP